MVTLRIGKPLWSFGLRVRCPRHFTCVFTQPLPSSMKKLAQDADLDQDEL